MTLEEGATRPRPRVAVLVLGDLLDGSDRARRALGSATALRRAVLGAEVTVVAVEPRRATRDAARRAEAEALARAEGAALVAVPRASGIGRLRRGGDAAALRRAVGSGRFDVVHAHGADAVAAARAALRATGARLVADVGDDRAASRRLERGLPDDPDTPPDPDEARGVREADAALYASRALAARFPAAAGAPRAIAPPTVSDASLLADDEAERERAARRAALGLAGPERVVAWSDASGGAPELPRLARALAHAMERVPQLRALLVVPEPATARRVLEAAGIGAGRAVVVAVRPADLVRTLLVADAAVLLRRPAMANALSVPAAFPDALAAGLQVVVSAALPEVADAVQRTPVLGHVLTWRSEDAVWAARIAGAARPQDPEARAARRAFARARHSAASATAAYRAVYGPLTGDGGRGRAREG